MTPSTPNIQDRLKAFLKDRFGIFLIRELQLPDTPPMTLRFGLAELAKEGFLIRISRGVYYRPPVGVPSFKRIFPDPDEVARAVAEKSSMKLIPSFSQSAYLSGLCRNAYDPYSYLTDGTSRKLRLYRGPELSFLHTKEARLFMFRSPLMRDLSGGLRYLGKGNITEREEKIVREVMRKVSREDAVEDLPKCPEWVREIMLGR